MIRPRKLYLSDVSDEEWSLVAPYLTLMREDASQREHPSRELFNGLRCVIRYGIAWRAMPNLTLNPNCAQAWLASAFVNCFANRNGAAIDALERAVRLSPLDPLGHLVKFGFGLAHLQSSHYEEAVGRAPRELIQK